MQDPELVVARLLVRADRLYSLPAVAMRVLELTRDPKIDTWALKQCIENDPALTGKILRVVNSSLFGLSQQVSDLHQALALLGTKPLKLLVLGFSLPPALFAGVSGDVLARYWRHTLTRAVVARELSERLLDLPGDEVFIAGLLQDLGVLLLIQEAGEPYVRLLEEVYASGRDLAELESEAMGFEHRDLSARLLAHWGLPEALVEAVDNGQQGARAEPESGARPRPAEIVRAAELLAELLADGKNVALRRLLDTPLGQHLSRLGREELQQLVEDFQAKVYQLAEVLSLQLPEGLDYRDVLVEAHAQLAEAASDVAEELAASPTDNAQGPLAGMVRQLADAVAEVSAPPPDPLDDAEPTDAEPRPATWAPGSEGGATATAVAEPRSSTRLDRPSKPLCPVAVPTSGVADPGLLDRLALTSGACRQCRCPLSLLLVQVDRYRGLAPVDSPDAFHRRLDALERACAGLDQPGASCLPYGEAGFALVLPACERGEAVGIGHRLIDEVGRVPRRGDGLPAAGVGVGLATVAMPPKNFAHEELLAAADRCLYGSLASGGGVVKSIEIY